MCKTCHDTGKNGPRYCLCQAGRRAIHALHAQQDDLSMIRAYRLADQYGTFTAAQWGVSDTIRQRAIFRGVLETTGPGVYRLPLAEPAEPPIPCTADDLFREVLKDHDTWRYGDADRGTPLDWYQHDGATAELWLELYGRGWMDLFADTKGRQRVRLPLVDHPQPESKPLESNSAVSGSCMVSAPDPHYLCAQCGRDLWLRSKRLRQPNTCPDVNITLEGKTLCNRCFYKDSQP